MVIKRINKVQFYYLNWVIFTFKILFFFLVKFADIDRNIKNLDQKLKEGTVRELGTNKVASITEKLVSKIPPEPKPPEKTVSALTVFNCSMVY